MNETIIKDIINTRNIIRKKYETLKSGRLENAIKFDEIFQPITTPLKKLVNATEENQPVKSELKVSPVPANLNVTPLSLKKKKKKKKKAKVEEESINSTSTPIKSNLFSTSNEYNSPSAQTSLMVQSDSQLVRGDDDASNEEEQQLAENLQSDFLHSTNNFIRSLNINDADFDNKYGPNFSREDNAWKIGSSFLSMDKNNIFIKDKVYDLTPGLKNLIFFKNPDKTNYDHNDILKYLEIVKDCNLLHRNYDETQQIAGNKSIKYNLIKKLISQSRTQPHTGSGLMQFSPNKTDYIYWDDPNELVDRFRLLLASQQAGHTGHNNEIISIINELKEANIII